MNIVQFAGELYSVPFGHLAFIHTNDLWDEARLGWPFASLSLILQFPEGIQELR